jgi:hypothetical protein
MEEAGKRQLERSWEWRRQGSGSWIGTNWLGIYYIGDRNRAVGKELGMEETGKSQLERGY